MGKAERAYFLIQGSGYPPGFFEPKFQIEGTKRSVPTTFGCLPYSVIHRLIGYELMGTWRFGYPTGYCGLGTAVA